MVSGAVLLDLKQRTLPGIAQQVVEQLVLSDQIKAEDRDKLLRVLLLRHRSTCPHILLINRIFQFLLNKQVSSSLTSHPSDEKDKSFFSRNISAAAMVSVMDRLNNQSELCCQKENPQLGNSRPEMQLMERISARAEATLVLVGTQQIQANAKSDSDFMERMSN